MPLVDVDLEMLADLVRIAPLAHGQTDRLGPLAPTGFYACLDSPQFLLRGDQPFFPLLRPPLRQGGIPARHQVLPRIGR